jgi:hypothetical protein
MADPIVVTKLGPGTLKIGETGTEIDMSCNVSEVEFATDKEQDDPVPVLCGREVASPATYTATLSGTALLNLADPESIFYYANEHKGETVPVEFVPNTEAGATISGSITLDPMGIAGDVAGNVESEFEWTFVEWPTITGPTAPAVEGAATRSRTAKTPVSV